MSRPEDAAVTGGGSPRPRGAEGTDTDGHPYQSPGGFWSASGKDPFAEPARCVDLPGMALDRRQHVALAATAREPEETSCVASAIENGLLYTGRCPRCGHPTQAQITFGLLVCDLRAGAGQIHLECDPSEPYEFVKARLRWLPLLPDPQADEPVERLTFVCSCGEPHPGRPDGAAFAGCGAVWNQAALGPAPGTPASPLEVGTPEDSLRAEQALALSQRSLDRIRAQATQWRTASGSLTAVLAAATLIGAPTAGHAPSAVTVVLAVLGFLALLGGTVVSVLAASAVSGYDHRMIAATVLPRYERRRGGRAIRQVQLSMIAMFVGVLLLAGSGLAALLA